MPVEVLHTHHPTEGDHGKFFYFDKDVWSDQIGPFRHGQKVHIAQSRNGAYLWTGQVQIWDTDSGTVGKRVSGAANSQWQTGDKIIKAVRVKGIYHKNNKKGRYFNFDNNLFLSQFNCSGQRKNACFVNAKQWRNGVNIWNGPIRSFGWTGRRNPLQKAYSGNWKVGDIITTYVAPTDTATDSPTDIATDSPTNECRHEECINRCQDR